MANDKYIHGTGSNAADDDQGFVFGGENGARLGADTAETGGRWSPIPTGGTRWRINGRQAVVTSLDVTYDGLSLGVYTQRSDIDRWRQEYETSGDVDVIEGVMGEFRGATRSADSLSMRVQPPAQLSPPLEGGHYLVTGYDDSPVGGGQEFEASFDLARIENAGPSEVEIPLPEDEEPTPTPGTEEGWGVEGWGDLGWGHPEDETEADAEAVGEADSVSVDAVVSADSGIQSTTAMLTGEGHQQAAAENDVIAEDDSGVDGETDEETTLTQAESIGTTSRQSLGSLGPLASAASYIGRPFGHDPVYGAADQWGFALANGSILADWHDVRPISDPGDSTPVLELTLDLDGDQARTLMESASHLGAVGTVEIPDGNNRVFDGTLGRNSATIMPPDQTAYQDGIYAVSDWSLTPTQVVRWECSMTLHYLWSVEDLLESGDETGHIYGYENYGKGQYGNETEATGLGAEIFGEGIFGETEN